jgi:TonB-linked SusC/RagA family outer membrane protein
MYKIYTKKIWLIMRLTTVILIAAIMQVSATGFAQRITLNERSSQMEDVLKKIRGQSGYDIMFDRKVISKMNTVNVSVSGVTLQQAMNSLLSGLPLTYSIDGKTILIKTKKTDIMDRISAAFNVIDATGLVLDEKGNPLPGASVSVKGRNQLTRTSTDGFFYLKNVDENAILEISYIGYHVREIKASSKLSKIILELADSKLDEVQIVAYGTTTRRLNVGAMTAIKSEEIERSPVSNVLSAIQGRVPGLQITQATGLAGGDYQVQLRGQNSLTGSSAPLYIIDGIPFPSVTTTKLRTRSAAGYSNPLNNINPYDIESITVLKDAAATSIYGARGANGVILITMKKGKTGDTRVNVNAYTGIGQDTRRKQMMNTSQYLEMRKEALRNGGVTTFTALNAPDIVSWDPNRNNDYQDELIGGTAVYNDVNASVSGGSGGTSFLIGAGYHRESTVFSKDPADRKGSLNFNINHLSKNSRFTAVLSGNYVNDRLTLPNVDLTRNSYGIPSNQPALMKNGNLVFSPGTQNPLLFLLKPYHSIADNLIANASLGYLILPGLQLKSTFGYNMITADESQLNPLRSFDPAQVNAASSSYFGENKIKTWNIEPQLVYNLSIGKGVLNALAGATVQSSFNHSITYTATGFINDAFLSNIQAAKSIAASGLTDYNTKYNSLFGHIGYVWDEKYIIDLSGRRDGSSRFGPGKQFGNFGAAGIGWIFSKEKLIAENLPFISFGKFKLSYGTVGNPPSADYQYLSQWAVSSSTLTYDGLQGLTPSNLYNPNFAWETTRKMEAGMELEFFQGRIAMNASYYHNRSSNQLVTYPLPLTTGFSGVFSNLAATVQNTGFEFGLQTSNIRSKAFEWGTNLNFSAPKNKLVAFPGLASSSYSSLYAIGQPIYVQKLYHYVDVDPQTGIYRFAGASGPTSSPVALVDQTVYYDPAPKYYGGLGNNFKYKGFDLDFFFTYNKQKAWFKATGSANLGVNAPVQAVDRWRKPGDISNIQKVTTGFDQSTFTDSYVSSSDAGIVDGSFIRLKNAALSYNIPASYMNKIHVQSCRVYCQAQNLFTITNYQGLDPETLDLALPPLRVISLGIQFTL